jgi:hypothetical protein
LSPTPSPQLIGFSLSPAVWFSRCSWSGAEEKKRTWFVGLVTGTEGIWIKQGDFFLAYLGRDTSSELRITAISKHAIKWDHIHLTLCLDEV